MSAHTKEPWFYGGSGCVMKDRGDHSDHVACDATPEDARRIVACVNACAGLDTALLENIVMLGDTLKQRIDLLRGSADATWCDDPQRAGREG